MPKLRIGEQDRMVNLRGSVYDHSDLLAATTRSALRSYVTGPWGDGDSALVAEMIRRTHTPPCLKQCFITAHESGGVSMRGCGCNESGWQYTDDAHVQTLEGHPPADVWNDARALLFHHKNVGRGDDDPILCDCDDLTIICASCAKYEAWKAYGSPTKDGRPVDPPGAPRIYTAIAMPRGSNTAHAFMMSTMPPMQGEPPIKVGDLHVFDPAGRWGMARPKDSFYGSGILAKFEIRFSDLAGD